MSSDSANANGSIDDNNIINYISQYQSNLNENSVYYDVANKLYGANIYDCTDPYVVNGRNFRQCEREAKSKLALDKHGCRFCVNYSSTDPQVLYHTLKVIQNQVRVPSSLYTMNLGALNVYQHPERKYQVIPVPGSYYVNAPGVNWNQMSDRKEPHVQKVVTASGSTYGGNSLKRSLVRLRPGAMSPGGIGVDIKHNSYDRYLNRIKGKAPLRRGTIPPYFGEFIPFNRAFPVYGGKVTKTNLVNGCNCLPIV